MRAKTHAIGIEIGRIQVLPVAERAPAIKHLRVFVAGIDLQLIQLEREYAAAAASTKSGNGG